MMIVLEYKYVLFCFVVYIEDNNGLTIFLTFLTFMTLSFDH